MVSSGTVHLLDYYFKEYNYSSSQHNSRSQMAAVVGEQCRQYVNTRKPLLIDKTSKCSSSHIDSSKTVWDLSSLDYVGMSYLENGCMDKQGAATDERYV